MTANAASRSTPQLAGEIARALYEGTVFTAPAQGAADYDKILAALTPADVAGAAARLVSGSGPLIFAVGASAPADEETGLLAAAAGADTQRIAALDQPAAGAWPYTRFGEPSRVIDRRTIADLGVTIVRFANGTSATIRSLAAPRDQISVILNFGQGTAGLPRNLERSYWQVTSPGQIFLSGGLGKQSVSDFSSALAGRRLGAQFVAMENRFAIAGHTSDGDLDTQLQLMTAYVADPAYRAAAFDKGVSLAGTIMAGYHSSASSAAASDLPQLLHGGDRRWSSVPTAADVAASRPEDLAAILRPALAGPINVVIVGDMAVDRAIAAAQATIGALPARGPRVPFAEAHFPAISPGTVTVAQNGDPDDAVAVAAWGTPGFFANMADARAVQVLAKIIEGRLVDVLREKDGVTYSPQGMTDQSELFASYGSIAVEVELRPGKTGLFFSTVDAIVASLAKTPVSADELNRVRAPMLSASKQQLHVTDYWGAALVGADEDPRLLDTIRTRVSQLASVTSADVQRMARTYLAGVTPYRVVFAAPAAGGH